MMLPLPVIKGLCSIKEEGLAEANQSINWALTCFKHVISTNGWRSMVLDVENEFFEDDEEEVEEHFVLADSD